MWSTKTLYPEEITYTEHAVDVLSKAADCIGRSRRFALIVSLAIQGGSSRELGSLALVDESGAMFGYLSNGCIDRDIRHQALAALAKEERRLILYGEGSPFMDLKLPCGGSLSVLIDPTPDAPAVSRAAEDLLARRPATLHFTPPQDVPDRDSSRAFRYAPLARLFLAGRGAILRATAMAGRASGFELVVLSPDEMDLASLRDLGAVDLHHLTSPYDSPNLSGLDSHSAFLTLFHDHNWEPLILREALNTSAFFIGSLGSRRTHEMRLDRLAELGVSAKNLGRVNGPIGVVPSLRSAPMIAVSSIAEIVSKLPPQILDVRF